MLAPPNRAGTLPLRETVALQELSTTFVLVHENAALPPAAIDVGLMEAKRDATDEPVTFTVEEHVLVPPAPVTVKVPTYVPGVVKVVFTLPLNVAIGVGPYVVEPSRTTVAVMFVASLELHVAVNG